MEDSSDLPEKKSIDKKLKFIMECIYQAVVKGERCCDIYGLYITPEMHERLEELGYQVTDGFTGYVRTRFIRIDWVNTDIKKEG